MVIRRQHIKPIWDYGTGVIPTYIIYLVGIIRGVFSPILLLLHNMIQTEIYSMECAGEHFLNVSTNWGMKHSWRVASSNLSILTYDQHHVMGPTWQSLLTWQFCHGIMSSHLSCHNLNHVCNFCDPNYVSNIVDTAVRETFECHIHFSEQSEITFNFSRRRYLSWAYIKFLDIMVSREAMMTGPYTLRFQTLMCLSNLTKVYLKLSLY